MNFHDYLQNLNLSFSETSSSGCRIHSNNNSGNDDSGLGDSQNAIKEEDEENDDQLNKTAPAVPTAAERRAAFAKKSVSGFKTVQHHSLDTRPSSTPRGRGRSTRGLRGRRGRRLTK